MIDVAKRLKADDLTKLLLYHYRSVPTLPTRHRIWPTVVSYPTSPTVLPTDLNDQSSDVYET